MLEHEDEKYVNVIVRMKEYNFTNITTYSKICEIMKQVSNEIDSNEFITLEYLPREHIVNSE